MKVLSGSELAGFIKERQAKQVRGLRQANAIFPRLAIIRTNDSKVIDTYLRLKKAYGADILIDVDEYMTNEDEAVELIQRLNVDDTVHGIIVQLPLSDISRTDELVDAVIPAKDVDALGKNATLDAATPMAINWLLAGYNIELKERKVVIVGAGRLVGAPLACMWQKSGILAEVVDEKTDNIERVIKEADIVVSATGVPGLITGSMLKKGAVVVDAGTASEGGKVVGDVAADVRLTRDDLTITPEKGGVGPLTVCALFDNVIRAARNSVTNN